VVLKDCECTKCGAARELFLDRDETTCRARCERCGRVRAHRSLCTGGTKKRWRFADLGGVDHSEYVDFGVHAGIPQREAIGTADESRGYEPICMKRDGSRADQQPRFSDDARKDRREQRKWKQRHAAGRTPLHYSSGHVGRQG
jgi:hypothetical protein